MTSARAETSTLATNRTWQNAIDYGLEIVHESPSFESMTISESEVTLTFKNVGSTLYTFDVPEAIGFAVAGEDQVWHWAKGTLKGKNQVVVSSEMVAAPVAVRYAWAENPVANLRSREGLPVIPFRTDDWPQITDPANAPVEEPEETAPQ